MGKEEKQFFFNNTEPLRNGREHDPQRERSHRICRVCPKTIKKRAREDIRKHNLLD